MAQVRLPDYALASPGSELLVLTNATHELMTHFLSAVVAESGLAGAKGRTREICG